MGWLVDWVVFVDLDLELVEFSPGGNIFKALFYHLVLFCEHEFHAVEDGV